jgi:hypothetical protein
VRNDRVRLEWSEAVLFTDAEHRVVRRPEGASRRRVGLFTQALEPPKTTLFVPAARVASARPVPLRLGPELLEAAHLVLTPLG